MESDEAPELGSYKLKFLSSEIKWMETKLVGKIIVETVAYFY